MDSILDAALGNSPVIGLRGRSAPRVVSEQHDVNAINWVGGLSDPGEMIGCGMYQELRRLNGETDEAYAARLPALLAKLPAHHRAKIEGAVKGAALRRAGLDTSNGRVNVVVVGQPAWHGLGVNVAEALTAADAIRLAGLGWSVSKRAMAYPMPDGGWHVSDQTFAVVRDDTHAQLGTVGDRYVPIQNAEGFEFLDAVIGEAGAKFHTAGSLRGGSTVWMQCELPRQSFEVVAGDRVDAYALFTNPHDGTGRAFCHPTTNRVVCANTFRTAAGERGKGIGIRHTGNTKASIADAQQALGLAVKGLEAFAENAGVMARTAVRPDDYFADVLDLVCEVTRSDVEQGADALAAVLRLDETARAVEAKRIQREMDRRAQMLEDILTRYETDRCQPRGTAWAAFNAVTEHADHAKTRRIGSEEAQRSRRFESIISGDADDVKQAAYQVATRAAN